MIATAQVEEQRVDGVCGMLQCRCRGLVERSTDRQELVRRCEGRYCVQ